MNKRRATTIRYSRVYKINGRPYEQATNSRNFSGLLVCTLRVTTDLVFQLLPENERIRTSMLSVLCRHENFQFLFDVTLVVVLNKRFG